MNLHACLASLVLFGSLLGSGVAQSASTWLWRREEGYLAGGADAAAYDPLRQRTLLRRNLTNWEWDGTRWRSMPSKTMPPTRAWSSMAYDPVRETILMYGGYGGPTATTTGLLGDLWEWDGRDWSQVTWSGPGPSPRWGPALGTDPVRKRVVLFGGAAGGGVGNGEVNDTWEWDGTRWTQLFPRTVPLPRNTARMAFCRKSGRMLMFGGVVFFGPTPTGTWEWDGTDWTLHRPPREPKQPLEGTAMATDPLDGTVLLHGGEWGGQDLNESWVWDGTTWTQVTTANDPPPLRAPTGLGSVDHTGEVLLYALPASGNPFPVRTWAWKGRTWRIAEQREVPDGVYASAYDGARDEYLVIGPYANSLLTRAFRVRDGQFTLLPSSPANLLGWPVLVDHPGIRKVVSYGGGAPQTWLWNGQTWTEDRPGGPSPPHAASAAAYDGHRGSIVILTRALSPETWEWTPAAGWVLRATAGPPGARREGATMAYDPTRRRMVLFGGQDPFSSIVYNDTWEWDGTQWRQAVPHNPLNPPLPPSTARHYASYIPELGGVVLLGGGAQTMYRWDGTSWQVLPIAVPPEAAVPYHATYSVGRQSILAFINGIRLSYVPHLFVWEMVAPTLTADQPYPRPGETSRLQIALPAQANVPWVMGLALADWPGIPLRRVSGVGMEVLPLRYDPLFLVSLSVPLAGVLDANGSATLPLPVPLNPWLIGFDVFAGAFTLQAGPSVGAITSGLRMSIVR